MKRVSEGTAAGGLAGKMTRRSALARLGVGVTVAYSAPMLMTLSQAAASPGSNSGGGHGGMGSNSGPSHGGMGSNSGPSYDEPTVPTDSDYPA